jgi:hypothetical protein
MKPCSDDEALNREHHQFLSVTVAIYLGGGLLFLVGLGLIMRFESDGDTFRALGWVEFAVWLVALFYCARCANHGHGIFRLLNQWERSLDRRKRDLQDLAAHRAGEILYRICADGVARPLEERDGVLVTKISVPEKGAKP